MGKAYAVWLSADGIEACALSKSRRRGLQRSAFINRSIQEKALVTEDCNLMCMRQQRERECFS